MYSQAINVAYFISYFIRLLNEVRIKRLGFFLCDGD